jgi:ubiquinone/menaquinone biosynthesis C-methylase UbiE
MDIKKEVIAANIQVHSKMAETYDKEEPHFRNENIQRVEKILKEIYEYSGKNMQLDMGCGTGFIINIAKKYVNKITGVDVTQAMLDRVDKSGNCIIELFNSDVGEFKPSPEAYNIVTGYAFLHHLHDIKPAMNTAFKALKVGGTLYCDLEPNYNFWESIHNLARGGSYDPIVKREIEMVAYKDEDVEKNYGVPKEVFDKSEWGKNIAGGFKEEDVVDLLKSVGFKEIKFLYHWFIGQAYLVNEFNASKEDRFLYASVMDEILHKTMPLARNLYKYIGFIAHK